MNTINSDQVAWLQAALWRFTKTQRCGHDFPTIAHYRFTNELACLLDIMAILGLKFEDEAAQNNALVHVKALSAANPNSASLAQVVENESPQKDWKSTLSLGGR